MVATTKRTYQGKVYCTHLLRRSYRDGDQVKHETLGNIFHLPADLIEGIRRRLATARALCEQTATCSLVWELGLDALDPPLDERDLYAALDWLLARQGRIETKLAKRHLRDGTLLLYDVSGSYYTGRHCSLAKFGHPRDGKKGVPQILYGLLCNAAGCPVAIEVFEGNTADPKTRQSQIDKVRKRFGVQRVVMVGDRGLITSRRIEESMRGVEGLDWITALRADSIRKLASQGLIQPSLFDQRDLAEVVSPDYPGERLVVYAPSAHPVHARDAWAKLALHSKQHAWPRGIRNTAGSIQTGPTAGLAQRPGLPVLRLRVAGQTDAERAESAGSARCQHHPQSSQDTFR